MGLEFINHVIKISLIIGAVALVLLAFYGDLAYAFGIFLGAAWGCINLFLLKYLIQSCITNNDRNYFSICAILGIKFPLLYLAGYGLLKIEYLPTISLLFGFSILFLVIFIKGIGIALYEKFQGKKV